MVKKLPPIQETQVQSLGQEDPLEKEMATHASIPAWKNPMDRGAWRATLCGHKESLRSLRDTIERLTLFTFMTPKAL